MCVCVCVCVCVFKRFRGKIKNEFSMKLTTTKRLRGLKKCASVVGVMNIRESNRVFVIIVAKFLTL